MTWPPPETRPLYPDHWLDRDGRGDELDVWLKIDEELELQEFGLLRMADTFDLGGEQ